MDASHECTVILTFEWIAIRKTVQHWSALKSQFYRQSLIHCRSSLRGVRRSLPLRINAMRCVSGVETSSKSKKSVVEIFETSDPLGNKANLFFVRQTITSC